jgi:hypothetical protein
MLYQHNALFVRLLRCQSQSMTLRKRIFYKASRRQTKSFRALMTSFKRMKKAVGGEFWLENKEVGYWLDLGKLNPYDLIHEIMQYFFQEMHNIERIHLEKLYSNFAEGSLKMDEYRELTLDGDFVPYQLREVEFSYVSNSFEDAKKLLGYCNLPFSFPEVDSELLRLSIILASEPVCSDSTANSTLYQGTCFVLHMISLYQSQDPFMGYVIRALYHSHDNRDDAFYLFHLNKMVHAKLIDGSLPLIVKIWNMFVLVRSQPQFLSIYPDLTLADMLKMFYDIINNREFLFEINLLISENSSANLASLRFFLRTMRETSLDKHFRGIFRVFLMPPAMDPTSWNHMLGWSQ